MGTQKLNIIFYTFGIFVIGTLLWVLVGSDTRQGYMAYITSVVLLCILVWTINAQMSREKFEHDPLLDLIKKVTEPIHPCIKDLEVYKSNTGAYTLNKKQIFLCLHDDDGNYYDLNSLIYIFIHEVSHFLNLSIGHNSDFQKINIELLERAEKLGIYNPKIPVVSNYKGT